MCNFSRFVASHESSTLYPTVAPSNALTICNRCNQFCQVSVKMNQITLMYILAFLHFIVLSNFQYAGICSLRNLRKSQEHVQAIKTIASLRPCNQ